jgi:hypothetical protein
LESFWAGSTQPCGIPQLVGRWVFLTREPAPHPVHPLIWLFICILCHILYSVNVSEVFSWVLRAVTANCWIFGGSCESPQLLAKVNRSEVPCFCDYIRSVASFVGLSPWSGGLS